MPEKPPSELPIDEIPRHPERRSGMVRIVNVSAEQEEACRDVFAELLRDQPTESFERKKTPAEREVIVTILKSMPEFVRAYGGQPVEEISETNFHIVDTVSLSEDQQRALLGTDVAGFYDFSNQRVLVLPDEHSLLTTAQRLAHEALHLQSFLSFSAESTPSSVQNDKTMLHLRRIGLSVFNDEHTKRFFRDLDEAMIEELTARFDARYFSAAPVLAPELEQREQMRNRI